MVVFHMAKLTKNPYKQKRLKNPKVNPHLIRRAADYPFFIASHHRTLHVTFANKKKHYE